MKPRIEQIAMTFPAEDLERWKRSPRWLLRDCPASLRKLLKEKTRNRRGRRFFGEAYVVANESAGEAWYGSFKWLTSPKWWGDRPLASRYQQEFRAALQRHFLDLEAFQAAVRSAARGTPRPLPAGPDLWLVTRRRHRFIEVKLPGDSLAPHQRRGLELIGKHLRASDGRAISIEVVTLSPR